MPVSTPNGYLDFTNATPRATKVIATSNVGVGISNPEFGLDVHGTANVGTLTATTATVSGNVYAPNLPLATIGSNLVTWNDSTGVFQDSGGLFSNKLAVVSEQPPSALAGASTTITNHGVYKVTASTGSPENAFDKSGATSWTASTDYGGGGGTGVYVPGTARLHTSTEQGDWIALEFPYKTTLRHLTFTGNTEKANLYATNDNITWTELKNWESGETTVVVDASENYKKYGLVTTKTTGSATLSLTELRFFTESFAIDGGKVAMASAAITGGNTVVDQTGPHARASTPLRKYPEVAMTSNVQGGYVATASSWRDDFEPWNAFSGYIGDDDVWLSETSTYSSGTATSVDTFENTNGSWIGITLPIKIKLSRVHIRNRNNPTYLRGPLSGIIWGSDGGSSWTNLLSFPSLENLGADQVNELSISTDSYYDNFRIQVTSLEGNFDGVAIANIEYYGYEETSDPDTSVDTTITSQFNLPDTTGVKLYIDGDKGSTPTDYSGEGHTLTDNSESFSGNAWSFSSLSTSNVTMSTGDFAMEGTHPHSVSLWFNAANVSSNATLFHVGTAAGEGDAKTAISLTETGHLGWIDGGDNQFLSSNTWHNLVYATQGGGGLRTCYLDGRKLGDVSDQDTFGDYPPFDMTTYSVGGYLVSASSQLSNYPSHYAFDGNTTHAYSDNSWISNTSRYDTTTGVSRTDTGALTTVDGVSKRGEWIQMEFPHKMVIDYVALAAQTDTEEYRAPKEGVIAGSNDGETWETMHVFTNQTSWTDDVFNNYVVDTNVGKGFKYVRIIIEKVQSGTSNSNRQYTSLAEIKFYGHKENDTTRFPVSSTVLKYPHIEMSGPAQRGYVASASRESSTWYAYKAFNGIFGEDFWSPDGLGLYYNGTDNAFNTTASNSSLGGIPGEWIKLETHRAIVLSEIKLWGRQNTAPPHPQFFEDFTVLGSNDDSTWTTLKTVTGATDPSTGATSGTTPYSVTGFANSNAYKYVGIVVTKALNSITICMSEIEIYGTEEDLDIVARVGEGLDGKVANFRVYDKYLHEEQALELWDAQKDQFGRTTSSVSVYKGHVGIGTTTPEAALTVMDEAEEMEEFPPRAMTADENYMDGHGIFKVDASEIVTGTNATINIFDKKSLGSGGSFWLVGNGAGYNATTGAYEGETDKIYRLGTETPAGHYITLEMPYRIKLEKYLFMPRHNTEYQTPEDFELWGSNDGHSWTKLHSVIGNTEYLTSVTYDAPQTNYYRYFGFIVTRTIMTGAPSGDDYMSFAELKFFGTRERGQSTLHDGELKLTKNLTVPRIGPPLDADDTPRRDRLVVEFNTSTNPTENETVRDTSGRGLDGFMYSGASYNATEKALVFDGSNDYIATTIPTSTGAWVHSVSLWLNTNSADSSGMFFLIGESSDNRCSAARWDAQNNQLYHYFYNNDFLYPVQRNTGNWIHFVFTYDGGSSSESRKLYVNGQKVSPTSSNTGELLDLSTTQTPLFIGSAETSNYINGSISNFKIYDVTLTADEAKRLYDMGRIGNVIAQPVHIAAPLYAPGVPVQFVSAQVHDKVAYSAAVTIHISPLDISITPHFSNSKIYLMWRIENELQHDMVFRIYRDSTLIGYNTVSGNVEWSGVTAASYDQNVDSTPEQSIVTWIDSPNTTSTVTYKVYATSSNSNARNLYLNRTSGSSGKSGHETGVSQKTAMEIAQ